MPIINPYGGYLSGGTSLPGMTPSRGGGVVNPYGGFLDALANKRESKTSKEQDALLAQIQKLVLLQSMQGGQQQQQIPEPVTDAPPTPVSAGPAIKAAMTTGSSPNPFNVGNVRPYGSSNGFQQPASFDDGVSLAVRNAQAYPAAFNKNQPMSLLQIGAKWAPVGDGANDPAIWAKNVAHFSGLPVDAPLDLSDPKIAASFARGVHGAEWGAKAVKSIEAYLPGTQMALPQRGALEER